MCGRPGFCESPTGGDDADGINDLAEDQGPADVAGVELDGVPGDGIAADQEAGATDPDSEDTVHADESIEDDLDEDAAPDSDTHAQDTQDVSEWDAEGHDDVADAHDGSDLEQDGDGDLPDANDGPDLELDDDGDVADADDRSDLDLDADSGAGCGLESECPASAPFCSPERSCSPVFDESFDTPVDLSANWVEAERVGDAVMDYTMNNLRIQAPRTSHFVLHSLVPVEGARQEYEVELNHAGYGRTVFWLFDPDTGGDSFRVELDTDDTSWLILSWGAFAQGGPANNIPEISSGPYMNRWVRLRVVITEATLAFYADDTLLLELDMVGPVPQGNLIGLSVGSVAWKSGTNDTSFRHVRIEVGGD